MIEPCAAEHDFTAADRNGRQIRRRLNAVRDNRVVGGVKRTVVDSVHDQRRRSGALDVGAHRRQHRAQIGDLRLAGRVVDDGRSLRVDGRSQDVFGGADTGELEGDVCAAQTVGGRLDIAVPQFERRTHRLESLEMHVDWAAAEIVATG